MSPGDFPAIVQAIHGHPPFAWQRRLLHEVITGGYSWQKLREKLRRLELLPA